MANKRKEIKAGRIGKEVKKVANRISHRSTTYPCFFPDLGEFSRSWSYRFAGAKIERHFLVCKCKPNNLSQTLILFKARISFLVHIKVKKYLAPEAFCIY